MQTLEKRARNIHFSNKNWQTEVSRSDLGQSYGKKNAER